MCNTFPQLSFFGHVHQLSYRWHTERKTGELLRILDRGSTSMEVILDCLVFQLVPTIADVIIATSFISTALNPWFGLILVVTLLIYSSKTYFCTNFGIREGIVTGLKF